MCSTNCKKLNLSTALFSNPIHLTPPQPHIPISVRNSRRSVDLVSLGYLGVLSLPLLLLLLLLFIVIAPFKSIYNHKLC